jgi:hypothetical protein
MVWYDFTGISHTSFSNGDAAFASSLRPSAAYYFHPIVMDWVPCINIEEGRFISREKGRSPSAGGIGLEISANLVMIYGLTVKTMIL